MQYFLYVTKSCNLSCSYCSGCDIKHGATESEPLHDIEGILDRIESDIQANRHGQNQIVFYGGEPLLNQRDIVTIIKSAKERQIPGIEFGLYTNGVLLDRIDPFILDNLTYLAVSVDGVEEVNDRYRGQGVYKTALENFRMIRPRLNGQSLVSITITPECPVYDAVTNLAEIFDNVHWNLVNDPNLPSEFLPDYYNGINRLVDWWVEGLRSGRARRIIPFQLIASLLISGERLTSFPCGCGDHLRVVDTDGSFFMCDELMDRPEFRIEPGRPIDRERWFAANLSQKCSRCEYVGICAGGCLNVLLFYPPRTQSIYCKATKYLIRQVESKISTIERCLKDGTISWEDIHTYAISQRLTECIP